MHAQDTLGLLVALILFNRCAGENSTGVQVVNIRDNEERILPTFTLCLQDPTKTLRTLTQTIGIKLYRYNSTTKSLSESPLTSIHTEGVPDNHGYGVYGFTKELRHRNCTLLVVGVLNSITNPVRNLAVEPNAGSINVSVDIPYVVLNPDTVANLLPSDGTLVNCSSTPEPTVSHSSISAPTSHSSTLEHPARTNHPTIGLDLLRSNQTRSPFERFEISIASLTAAAALIILLVAILTLVIVAMIALFVRRSRRQANRKESQYGVTETDHNDNWREIANPALYY